MTEIPNNFKKLDHKYSFEQREEVAGFLFKKNGWLHCPVSKTWRKAVTENQPEFEGEEEVLFIHQNYRDDMCEAINYWYRVLAMTKDYLAEKNVYYQEPLIMMMDKAQISLLVCCAVYFENIENTVYQNSRFHAFELAE